MPINTQVNFSAMSLDAPLYDPKDSAKYLVLSSILRNEFLHRKVREQGGAYGGGAIYDPFAGSFKLFSYRDPRFLETFEDFEESFKWAAQGNFDDEIISGQLKKISSSKTFKISSRNNKSDIFFKALKYFEDGNIEFLVETPWGKFQAASKIESEFNLYNLFLTLPYYQFINDNCEDFFARVENLSLPLGRLNKKLLWTKKILNSFLVPPNHFKPNRFLFKNLFRNRNFVQEIDFFGFKNQDFCSNNDVLIKNLGKKLMLKVDFIRDLLKIEVNLYT